MDLLWVPEKTCYGFLWSPMDFFAFYIFDGAPVEVPLFPMDSVLTAYGFRMVYYRFLWISYGFPMASYGFRCTSYAFL